MSVSSCDSSKFELCNHESSIQFLSRFNLLVDTIGLSGEDAVWDVGDGDLLGGTTENSGMIRVATVEAGEADWSVAAMQWIVIDDRDYTDVGLHTHTPAS